jgi:chromosome transmission fidelity protein 4
MPSMLAYRHFDAWADNSEWSVGLPAGEEAECIAAGISFCAAATSARMLRIFTQVLPAMVAQADRQTD